MNVLHWLPVIGKILPLLKSLMPLVQMWAWVVPALFLALRERHIRTHLPAAVSRWLNDPALLNVVKMIAQRADLDSAAKRAEATARIEAYLKGRGIDLPEHLINLLLELIVARLHKEGVL